jgi:hypothetical protein
MKRTAIIAALGLVLMSAPAFAGGKGGGLLNIGANVSTGKNGVLGSLLGGGKNTISVDANVGKIVKVNADVKTGKNGLLGGLLGGGHGCGCK